MPSTTRSSRSCSMCSDRGERAHARRRPAFPPPRVAGARALLALVLLLAGAVTASAAESEGFRVIVHADNGVSSLTRDRLSKLFLKKVTNWEDGQAVLVVELAESSPVREAFSKQVHGRSLAAVRAYWQQKIYSGADVPPSQVGSDAEVVAYVRSHPAAIGYVSPATNDP